MFAAIIGSGFSGLAMAIELKKAGILGALSNPAYPKLRGIERFKGAQFHSARWRHDYDLSKKRVAVIGTGASAIQFVPQIQPKVDKLFLLQRTPPWVLPRPDRAFSSWEKEAFRAVPALQWLYRQSIYWRLEARVLAFVNHPALMRVVEHEGKRHLARSISDPRLRELLTPRYQPGCKRLLLSNDYYPALAQPNVEVLGNAVVEVSQDAITLDDGRRLEVDAILYGTGFTVHDYLGGMRITGRNGTSLADQWKDGAEAYLGTTVAGFPNLFMMTGPNTGLGHNSMIVMIEGQARLAGEAIRLLRDRSLASIEVRPEVQASYNTWLQGRTSQAVWGSGCSSWYLNEAGKNTTLWPGFTAAFRLRTAHLRINDYELRAPSSSQCIPGLLPARLLGRGHSPCPTSSATWRPWGAISVARAWRPPCSAPWRANSSALLQADLVIRVARALLRQAVREHALLLGAGDVQVRADALLLHASIKVVGLVVAVVGALQALEVVAGPEAVDAAGLFGREAGLGGLADLAAARLARAHHGLRDAPPGEGRAHPHHRRQAEPPPHRAGR